jgi:hypothetical protein
MSWSCWGFYEMDYMIKEIDEKWEKEGEWEE